MTDAEPTDAEAAQTVRRKAARMARARRQGRNFWRTLSHVGVLGWLFVLPLVLGVLAGRYAADETGREVYVIVGLLVGLAIGGYVAWKAVRGALAEVKDEDETGESEEGREA